MLDLSVMISMGINAGGKLFWSNLRFEFKDKAGLSVVCLRRKVKLNVAQEEKNVVD